MYRRAPPSPPNPCGEERHESPNTLSYALAGASVMNFFLDFSSLDYMLHACVISLRHLISYMLTSIWFIYINIDIESNGFVNNINFVSSTRTYSFFFPLIVLSYFSTYRDPHYEKAGMGKE